MDLVLSAVGMEVVDPDATAAVLLASLTFLPILQGLVGRTPGDVEPDRDLDGWVDHAVRTITSTPALRAGDRRRS